MQVEKPAEGFFGGAVRASARATTCRRSSSPTPSWRRYTALGLLDGSSPTPSRCGWRSNRLLGPAEPLTEEAEAPIDVKLSVAGSGRELSQRLARSKPRSSRRKTIEFSYYSLQRDEVSDRKVNPYHLVFRDGQFYLIGHSHERDEVRVFQLSRINGKVSYATKAEHDFAPPEDFDRRDYGTRAEWQMGEIEGTSAVFLRERIVWLVERDFGRHGAFASRPEPTGSRAGLGVPGRARPSASSSPGS